MDKITNLIDQLLDLPKTVNEKLPSNNFNAMMDNSEGSIAGWTGTFYRYGAFVVLVGALVAVVGCVMIFSFNVVMHFLL